MGLLFRLSLCHVVTFTLFSSSAFLFYVIRFFVASSVPIPCSGTWHMAYIWLRNLFSRQNKNDRSVFVLLFLLSSGLFVFYLFDPLWYWSATEIFQKSPIFVGGKTMSVDIICFCHPRNFWSCHSALLILWP